MLIRVCDHFHNNPKRIDKLIAIKGLPDEWFFRESPEGKELKKPWEPDIDKNIPFDIRHLCEPMYIILRYSPIQAGSQGTIEKRQILGVRIDFNSEPGREMWERVERYIEETMPRDERIPAAVLCARDERSAFETYAPRRNNRGALELVPSPIPMVDLTQYQVMKVQVKAPEPISPAPASISPPVQETLFNCDQCDYKHAKKQGLAMHKVKMHPKKEKVEA